MEAEQFRPRLLSQVHMPKGLGLNVSVTDLRILGDYIFQYHGDFIAKTTDPSAPLKIYDFAGEKLTEFGKGVPGATEYGGLGYDTLRQGFIYGCNGHVTLTTINGDLAAKMPLPSRSAHSVVYSRQRDVYIVSDPANSCLVIVDPKVGRQVRTIGQEGSKRGEFKGNYNMTYLNAYKGAPAVAVSEEGNNRIQVMGIDGKTIDIFGNSSSTGETDTTQMDGTTDDCYDSLVLNSPQGLDADHRGRFVVCDFHNSRVIRTWKEKGKTLWENVLEEEKDAKPGKPAFVSLADTNDKHMMVIRMDEQINVYQLPC